jgi:hypothetical protein
MLCALFLMEKIASAEKRDDATRSEERRRSLLFAWLRMFSVRGAFREQASKPSEALL